MAAAASFDVRIGIARVGVGMRIVAGDAAHLLLFAAALDKTAAGHQADRRETDRNRILDLRLRARAAVRGQAVAFAAHLDLSFSGKSFWVNH